MSEKQPIRLTTIEGGLEEDLNKAHTCIEFDHADEVIRRERVHGKIEITYVDGEASLLRREVNIPIPRNPRKKPPLA